MVNKVTLGTVMDIIAVTPVTKNLRRFLISGITNEEEVYALRRSIESLGGTIEDRSKNKFTSLCTHVIAKEVCATEKVLGALAGGKWLLQPAYVKASLDQGRWVKENAYELKHHGEVAKYCRQWKEKRGSGIYSGWTVYIELENPRMTKAFQRIVAAGGAEGVSMSEISKVDLVISEKAICPTIRELVGVTPIVSITYIKDTLILKTNPSDLRDYLLDKKSKSCLPNKNSGADIQVLRCDSSLTKRPIFEVPINNNKKLCTRPKIHSALSYQQTSLDRYVKKSPRNSLSSICPVSQVSSKPQNRKYQHFPFTPEKHSTSIKYFAGNQIRGGSEKYWTK
ncbi:SMC5-SMC6 complex localization factor protein 1-like [Homarus americanus]|uniref:SMC5-SMC6 complex localization factor protein 1-like n=1 Tax=Homarus americanus TaxID=6706 RepID=UPI001C438F73|nr:SMC5-SMC6 complex localization factor protein 1-like [Homarus americanus]